jgi:HEXXH motif-containing protein
LVTLHSLSAPLFRALAAVAGDNEVVGQLREAQHSKTLMLLRVVTDAARADAASPEAEAFLAGYQLLSRAQAADRATVARVLSLPHLGSWAHDCLARLDQGKPPDFAYLAGVALSAAVRLGLEFELRVPVRDGGVLLPGLGRLRLPACEGEWVTLRSDGIRLRAGAHLDVACADLVPDDGSGNTVPQWQGTPLVRAVASGRTWEVLLEGADRHLDRYTLPMLTGLTGDAGADWRGNIESAWALIVRHHEWAAGPVAAAVEVIVPLSPRSQWDSATSPAAFGALATSLPPSPVRLAETLVHEHLHTLLCGLTDMIALTEPSAARGYAPWREDPRPYAGILQGTYAFTGIVRFWEVQRHLETGADSQLRAQVEYERWRLALAGATATLLGSGYLTPAGVEFVTVLAAQGPGPVSKSAPPEAVEVAREIALDHRLTWQLRHVKPDTALVVQLTAAYRRGEPLAGQLPAGDTLENHSRLDEDVRKVDSVTRSRLLSQLMFDPSPGQQLSAADAGLAAADVLLLAGDAEAAVTAYREQLSAESDASAWLGLALAVHRRTASAKPSQAAWPALAGQLPLLYDLHERLAADGCAVDPLELAAWLS